ncbi:MAG: O-antigen ligase family protein [Miltoncostaeaceae bacterium]
MSSDAPAPPVAATAPRPPLIALGAGAVLAGALAVVQPLAGIALALMTLVVVLLRTTPLPRLGRVLVALTAGAAVLGPNLAAPPIPWLFAFRILIVLLGLGVVAYLLMDGRLVLPAGVPRPAALLGAWLVWSLLSIGWAGSPLAALRWSGLLAMGIVLAVGIAVLCRERRRAIVLLAILGGVFALACLVALAEIATGFTLPTSRASGRLGAFGATSLFGNENNFAVYLALTLPFFAALPIVYRDVRIRAIGYVGAVLCLLFVMTTGSKSALLAVGLVLVGMLVVIGFDRERRGRLVVGGAVAGLAALLVIPSVLGGGIVPLPESTVTKFDFNILRAQVETQSGSGGVRASLFDEGLALVDDSDYLGVGAGNAETEVQALANFPGVGNLHNWWLEVLVTGGVVAFVLYVAFYLLLLRGTLGAARRGVHPFTRYLGLAAGLATLGWAAGSIGPSTAIAFAPMWVTFGLAMGAIALARREAS